MDAVDYHNALTCLLRMATLPQDDPGRVVVNHIEYVRWLRVRDEIKAVISDDRDGLKVMRELVALGLFGPRKLCQKKLRGRPEMFYVGRVHLDVVAAELAKIVGK